MDILLRIGNGDTLLIELFLHLVSEVPVDGPVIIGLDPWPTHEVHGGVGQLVDADDRFGVIEHQLVVANHLLQDRLRLAD